MYKSRFRPLALFLVLVCTFTFLAIPVSATETTTEVISNTGWVELRATVPENFRSAIIVSFENMKTLETYDIDLLPDNDYVASKELPAGEYILSWAFVYQNYTYTVSVNPTMFTIEADSAATLISVNVIEGGQVVVLPEETEATTAPTESEPAVETETTEPAEPSTEPSEEASTATTENNVSDEDESSSEGSVWSTIGRVLVILFGTGIFVGVVFLGAYLYRRYFV